MTIGNWIINAGQRDSVAVEYKVGSHWQQLSWTDYLEKVTSAYQALLQLGVQPRQHVGLLSSTRWEWSAIDLALLGSNSVVIPLYPNLSDEELTFIVNHSDISILIAETEAHQKQFERIQQNLERPVECVPLQNIDFQTPASEETKQKFWDLCRNLKSSDVATIVYTSGTTGRPKGAVLLHEAIVSEVSESFDLFGVKPTDKALTFLPYAHVLGRIEHWGSCYKGHALAYAESIERIKSNLKEVKPDFLIAVPRIFEKVYSGIMAQVETQKAKQKIFQMAIETAKEVQKYRRTKQTIPWLLLLKYQGLHQLAFTPVLDAFGGRLKFVVSGGAPLDSELSEFFWNCGIPLLEGYGLTETSAAITVNTLNNHQVGTVGKPIGDVKIKFAEDGEILVKSKKCLKEYYKNPEETAKAIQDGYFATGDVGELTSQGYLKITDRKKDLIKTSGGKYVAPQKLEGLLKQDPLVSQVLIHGDQRKFISALITLEEAQVKQWATGQGIQYETLADLYHHPILRARLQKHIQNINSKLASYESIKKFEVILDTWTVEGGELTPSLKAKRKFLETKYADLISEIYD
ncbi:AMP-dependent synthetase/ligase [Pseudobdellovibrio exovorus]|uniref:Long-chain fatty-acid-CoA ligase n=1 Tax=Pseudobdellovibrio exovorus JSS TaxID=1184267 RepID=M4VCK6_9BACT|nr:long-chain fatty acid--CoA ligase [Pseudobdellovibrio exovorus]AGH96215.1 long-chain fatty-acid-CoA ligase [Pseudobdellovibrio exovorus JSS]